MFKIIITCLMFFPLCISAQLTDTVGQNTASNYYFLARTSDITMKVVVAGDVKAPGLYEVKKGLRLNEVLALSGGPNLAMRQYQDQHSISIRLSRKTDTGRIIMYDETLDNYMVSIEDFPQLQEDDILLVESVIKPGFGKRDIFSLAGIGLSVIGIVISLLRN